MGDAPDLLVLEVVGTHLCIGISLGCLCFFSDPGSSFLLLLLEIPPLSYMHSVSLPARVKFLPGLFSPVGME